MNERAELQALRDQVLAAHPAEAPDPSPEIWAWLHDGAPLAAAAPASPWTRLVGWFAGLGVAVQSLVGTSVALAVVAGAGAAGVLPTPVQDVIDDFTVTRVPAPDAVDVEAEDSGAVPVQTFAPETVPALVLEPSDEDDAADEAEDRAEDAADEAEDRADEQADRDEDAREDAEDRAEDEADEAEDRADEAQDRAEDAADDKADADEDAADEAEDRAEDEADRAEDAKENESGDR